MVSDSRKRVIVETSSQEQVQAEANELVSYVTSMLNCTSTNSGKCNKTHVDIQAQPEWIYSASIDGGAIRAVLVYLKCEREGWVTVTDETEGVDDGYAKTGPEMHGIAIIKVNREEHCFIENAYIKRVYRHS
jgi:hypothetical protein